MKHLQRTSRHIPTLSATLFGSRLPFRRLEFIPKIFSCQTNTKLFHQHLQILKTPTSQQQETTSSKQYSNPFVSSLRKFFLKVHPDFFNAFPVQQKANQKSFQELNDLLNWVSKIRTSLISQQQLDQAMPEKFVQTNLNLTPPFLNTKLVFYLKNSSGKGFETIEYDFALKSDYWTQTNILKLRDMPSKRVLKRVLETEESVDQLILSLLSQAGVEVSEEAKEELEKQRSEQRGQIEDEEEEIDPVTGRKNEKQELREALRLALVNNIQGRGQLASRKYHFREDWWWDQDLPTVEDLIKSRHIFFSKELTPRQSFEAVQNLKNNLKELQFFKWHKNALSFSSNKEYKFLNRYMISVPYNFDKNEFNEFINQNEKFIQNKMKENEQLATKVNSLIVHFEKTFTPLQLDLESDLEEAIPFLERMKTIDKDSEHVLKEAFSNLHIKLISPKDPSKNRIDKETGAIIMKANLSTQQLLEFLHFLGKKRVDTCKELAKNFQMIEERKNMVLNDLTSVLRCKEIDISEEFDKADDNALIPAAEKLLFLQRLDQQKGTLKANDWEDYTFKLIGDADMASKISKTKASTVMIDTNLKVVFLALHFDSMELINKANLMPRVPVEKLSPMERAQINPTHEAMKKKLQDWSELRSKSLKMILSMRDEEAKFRQMFRDLGYDEALDASDFIGMEGLSEMEQVAELNYDLYYKNEIGSLEWSEYER